MTTKEKILQASMRHFLIYGYDHTALSTIADEVNIKKPSIYHHYPSKETLLEACVDGILGDLTYRIESVLSKSNEPKVQIESLFETIIDYHTNLSAVVYQNYHQMVNVNALLYRATSVSDNLNQKIEVYYQFLQKQINQILVSGQKQGIIKPTLNKEIASFDLLARIEGMLNLTTLSKSSHIVAMRSQLYETVWDSVRNEHYKGHQQKKKKLLDYKSIDIARKW